MSEARHKKWINLDKRLDDIIVHYDQYSTMDYLKVIGCMLSPIYLCHLCCVSLIINKAAWCDISMKQMLPCLFASIGGHLSWLECSLELEVYLEQTVRTL